MELIGYGGHHNVYEGKGGYVRKFPNPFNSYSIDQIQTTVDFYREYLSRFCPPTKIKEHEGKYIIIQKEIKGRKLSQTNPSELSQQTLEDILIFIDCVTNILNNLTVRTDVNGIREGETPLESRQRVKSKNIEGVKNHYSFVSNIFDSTNIIIDSEGKIWFIDNGGELFELKEKPYVGKWGEMIYRKFIYRGYKKQILDILKKRA